MDVTWHLGAFRVDLIPPMSITMIDRFLSHGNAW
jgi:hypothetical protein